MSEIIKRFIRETETGVKTLERQYSTIIGHFEDQLPKPLVEFTIDEIIAASDGWRKAFGTTSGAAGAYQIIKPTMIALKKKLNLTGSEKFTGEMQERLGDRLLADRGLAAFIRGDISMTAFGNNLAKEWASLPLLSTAKRGQVTLKRGQSYYDKVAGNSALVTPGAVEAVLTAARNAERPPTVTPAPGNGIPTVPVGGDSAAKPRGLPWGLIIAAVLVAVGIFLVFFWKGF